MNFFTFLLILMGQSVYSESAPVRVQLTISTPEIVAGEQLILANLRLTNTSNSNLEVPLPGTERFNSLLLIDDQRLVVWESLVYLHGESPTAILRPGESISTKQIYINENKKGEIRGSSIEFRIG